MAEIFNPNFEQGFRHFAGEGPLYVANSWMPWWKQRQDGDPQGENTRPEYKDATIPFTGRFIERHAQQWFTWSSKHNGGILQTVACDPVTVVQVRAQVQQWCMNRDGSEANHNLMWWIGIDPLGERDPFSERVQWGEEGSYENDTWNELASPEVEVLGEAFTVFIRTETRWGVQDNNAYVDNVELAVLFDPDPPEPPDPPDPDPEPPDLPGESYVMITSPAGLTFVGMDAVLAGVAFDSENNVVRVTNLPTGETVIADRSAFLGIYLKGVRE
jgi:hypothetical protein